MRTLVGAAEPEPRPWNAGQPVVLPILTGPQPQWWPNPTVGAFPSGGGTTTTTTNVMWWPVDAEPTQPRRPIRTAAYVGRSTPEIEAP